MFRQVASSAGRYDYLASETGRLIRRRAGLPQDATVVQIPRAISEADFKWLAGAMKERPEVELRTYYSAAPDLEFLQWFPFLSRFSADTMWDQLANCEGLRFLENPYSITLGHTKRPLDVSVLARFDELQKLYLEGPLKGIEAVSSLISLRNLTLRSITLPSLEVLLPLKELTSLDIKLGGTRNLAMLAHIGKLEYLELWMIRGLDDVSAIADVTTLEKLKLESLKRVTKLPSFEKLRQLREVILENMKGITDLSPINTAPRLEELSLTSMQHLKLEQLMPLVGNPTLKKVRPGLGSTKKNEAAAALFAGG